MDIFEKAKELGSEIRKTEEFKELNRTTENVKGDPEASQLIEEIQKLQQQIQFSQQSGVQPSQEQVDEFNAAKGKMDASLTIQAYGRARNNFDQLMQDVNKAIGDGINPEEKKEE
ncbi:MAG: YlbF family regulator [Bacillota bacterium]|nr:YlbF family regulator [Bacillota bacterium]